MMRIFSFANDRARNIILKNEFGGAIVEYAALVPVFIILVLSCVELGMYFVKDEITASAVNSISQAIQRDPSLTNAQLQQLAQTYGAGLIKFETGGNYICGRAYTTNGQATSAAPCTDTNFFITNPGTAGNPYYVVLSAGVKNTPLTPVGNMMPTLKNIKVSQSSGTIQVGNLLPPLCNQPGTYLQWNGSSFVCAGAPIVCNSPGSVLQWDPSNGYTCVTLNPPNCSNPWQKLEYNNNAWQCVNVSYVVAAGIAHPTSPWITEQSMVLDWNPSGPPWSLGNDTAPNRITICETGVKFSIPSGMPDGQFLIQGNLIYNTGNGEGEWHDWAVSFQHLNVPSGGGTGSTDVCMANGGNWTNSGSGATVSAEHVSWTLTFVPN